MPIVWIPAPMRDLTHGHETVTVGGTNVRQVIAELERLYPGMQARLCDGDGMRKGIAVVVDSQVASLGLIQPVRADSEVHFLPAIGGGEAVSRWKAAANHWLAGACRNL